MSGRREAHRGTGDALPRAYAQARRHSSRVRLLRRAIPVGAGLAVTAVVAFAWLDPMGKLGAAVTLGPVSVSGTKVVMENPRLSGYRKDARPYEVTASTALQDVRKPTLVELKGMRGRIALDDGSGTARLEAGAGVFDTQKEQLSLAEGVRVSTDQGHEARLRTAAIDFKAGTVTSREPVTVLIPNGSVEAEGGVEISDNGKVISFLGGVRAVFRPAEAPQPALPLASAEARTAEAASPEARP